MNCMHKYKCIEDEVREYFSVLFSGFYWHVVTGGWAIKGYVDTVQYPWNLF